MARTMVNHLSNVPLENNYAIFKAFMHRLMKEYGVEVVGVSNINERLINAPNEEIILTYIAHHHGRKLKALYCLEDNTKPSLTLKEFNSLRCIAFTADEVALESLSNAINNVKSPLQFPCSNSNHRSINSLLADHSMRLINFLDGEKEEEQATPAEPVFLTPTAPNRIYTLN